MQRFLWQINRHPYLELVTPLLGSTILHIDTNAGTRIFDALTVRGQFAQLTGNRQEFTVCITIILLVMLYVHSG